LVAEQVERRMTQFLIKRVELVVQAEVVTLRNQVEVALQIRVLQAVLVLQD
jgi:hypothetical protein